MSSEELHTVTRTEIHYLPACPCDACEAERQRRQAAKPTPSHVMHLSPDNAHTLGILRSRSPAGSVARQLMGDG